MIKEKINHGIEDKLINHIININSKIKQKININEIINQSLQYENVDLVCVINILITNDAEIQRYNREYRGVDKATDVLSFPMQVFECAGWGGLTEPEIDEDSGELLLGDVVISYETVEKHAEEYGNTVEYEMAYMVVHSVLHLLGYDHGDDVNERVMHDKAEGILVLSGFLKRD